MTFETAFTMDTSSIKYGPGVTREIGYDMEEQGCHRVMVVTDRNLSKSDPVAVTLEALRGRGIDTVLFDQSSVEPTDVSFKEAIAFAVQGKFDGYVAVGGGSSMDTCKAANLYATHPADLMTYVNPPIGKGTPVPGPLKPMMAIPTTAGTGSEMTSICVLSDTKNNVKKGIVSEHMFARVALLDPQLTMGMPPRVTAMTGMDALVHAIESFVGVRASVLICFEDVFPHLARASVTAVRVSASCLAYPLTTSTRLGIRSLRRCSWFSTCAHWALMPSSWLTKRLYEQPEAAIPAPMVNPTRLVRQATQIASSPASSRPLGFGGRGPRRSGML